MGVSLSYDLGAGGCLFLTSEPGSREGNTRTQKASSSFPLSFSLGAKLVEGRFPCSGEIFPQLNLSRNALTAIPEVGFLGDSKSCQFCDDG